eukprot:m.41334 g.41334  ORF g.41334 m.41334 type:complete len:67 (+) comp11817_c1_seq2:228-428(+)
MHSTLHITSNTSHRITSHPTHHITSHRITSDAFHMFISNTPQLLFTVDLNNSRRILFFIALTLTKT